MLNQKQLLAIQSKANKIVINASVGTGKTYTSIAAAEEYKFGSTVMITFTNKAAEEILSRLHHKPSFVGTIHRFSRNELLRLAKKYNFRVRLLKESSIRKIIERIFDENDFGIYVSNLILKEAYNAIITDEFDYDARKIKLYREVQKLYQKFKLQNQFYDLTDTPKYLLQKLNELNITLDYELVIVDEAQDLDPIQYDLVQKLGKKIIAIGDPKQSIYLFRGATPQIFDRFAAEGYEMHTLDINYRSKQEIVENASLNLKCIRGSGGQIINNTKILAYAPEILCRTNAEVNEIKRYYPNVMTIHAAKGLEFDSVCVIDFELKSEEDENIMFVALTRAKDRVGVVKFSDAINLLTSY